MPKTTPIFKSFSFRTGLLIFTVLSVTLVTLRILVHVENVHESYKEAQILIEAHADEINQDMESIGARFVFETIDSVLEDAKDENLVIGIRGDSKTAGNFTDWESLKGLEKEAIKKTSFQDIKIKAPDGTKRHIYAGIIRYPQNVFLVIGYNLKNIDYIRSSFYKVLLENIALAFVISMAISFMIIWIMNRHFRRFNIACDRVMSGDMDYRIKVTGNSDQFDQLAINLNKMLDWNNALIATVRDSSNAIAHDMRTPLSRLRLKLSAIGTKSRLSQEVREELGESVLIVDRMVDMFENLLKIARAESRVSTDLFENLDIRALVEDIVEFFETALEDKQITLTRKFEIDDGILKGDRHLLGQALFNILDNAYKYTPKGGHITISLSGDNSNIVLIIEDNGPGIPEDVISRVHERFFRADDSRHSEGYGLGLSLVHAVATLHRAKLTFSNINPGLRVTLEFKIAK